MTNAKQKSKIPKRVSLEALELPLQILFTALSESDFCQAGDAARAALKLVGDERWQPTPEYLALSDSAIIRYARPFMGNKVPGRDQKAFLPLAFLPDNIQGVEAFHKSVMSLRHQFGAHSDMSQRDARIEKSAAHDGSSVWQGHALCAFLQPPDLYSLTRVADALVEKLKRELTAIAEKAFPNAEMGYSITITARS